MKNLPQHYLPTLKIISEKLLGKYYCIRGTTGLILQGYDMGLDDVDILTDKETALEANILLKGYLVEPVTYREGAKFKSYYGKFEILGVPGEIYGEWQIKTKDGWSGVYEPEDVVKVTVGEVILPVSPPDLELKVYADMERWNAFHKLKKQMKVNREAVSSQPGLFP